MGLMFHVDESADVLNHFHGGVLVDARDAAKASRMLDEIVWDASDKGACRYKAELHAADIVARRGDWRKATIDQAIDVYRRALGVLRTCNVEVIAHGANLSAVQARYGAPFDPYLWEFRNLLERLNERLIALDDYAVVIADHHAAHRNRLQRDVISCREMGTGGYRDQKLLRIVDTAHFVDSRLSRMTQLADLVVFVLRRRRRIPTENDRRAEQAWAELDSLVWRAVPSPTRKYVTVRT